MPPIASRLATVGEHDVQREERGVGERERQAQRLGDELHVGEQVDARHRERQRRQVARRTRADRGERDDRQELDRGDGAEREPVDRHVEADVHQREDGTPGDQQPPSLAVLRRVRAPGPAPEREDQRRRGDPQPRDAEHVDAREEQHSERRAEVVEDGAAEEVQVGRRAFHGLAEGSSAPGGGYRRVRSYSATHGCERTADLHIGR